MLAMVNAAETSLRTLAAAAGYRSLRALAMSADVDRMTIRLALRGERQPHRSTVMRLARALRVDADLVTRVFTETKT